MKRFISLYKPSLTFESKLGPKIGYGAEGDVYHYNDNKVIKIFYISGKWYSYKRVLKFLIENPQKHFVKVYDFGMDNVNCYYYITELLSPLSDEERSFIDKYCVDENNNIVKNIPTNSNINPKLIKCLKQLSAKNLIFSVNDVHGDNIMIDKNGTYKMADLGYVRFKRSFILSNYKMEKRTRNSQIKIK